jgi:hypothetical protein
VAAIRCDETGVLHPLAARTLIGRSAGCALEIAAPLASAEHATLSWSGGIWEVRDLGSRNGTYVAGKRIDPGAPVPLAEGMRLGFGSPSGYTLIDASAPGPVAIDLESRHIVSGHDGILALPAESEPILTVYGTDRGTFVVEDGDTTEEIGDYAIVRAGPRSYRIALPVVLEATPIAEPRVGLDALHFTFGVSRNEEFVALTVRIGERVVELEPRDYHYVLLTLARIRRQEADLEPGERGWVDRDQVLEMLAMEPNTFNVAVHRARLRISSLGVEGAAGIVEVRPRQRRFGTDRFTIAPIG